ncbi:hypothetical protein AMATHDRAFT_71727 [Amanita thiersii Skay4041]|uniref:FAR-17a/AIG1-like protein n=1 Tax=Amanita thiersii Skay4041 TaxID=703135 RepID=A0A2A9N6P1_9AGAR|nr:hypothetical protein AMATHDRAFT_71727 [Amanita thiersii Skay4041]
MGLAHAHQGGGEIGIDEAEAGGTGGGRVNCMLRQLGLAPKGTRFDSTCTYVTSPFVSTGTLAYVRLFLGFYTLITLVFTLAWDSIRDGDGDGFFSYFTHLSYIGLCAYLWAAGVQTYVYATRGVYLLQRWPRALQYFHVLLYATVATFPIVVTAVFWALLASPNTFKSTYSAWSNISVHILNTVFALIELFLTNVPPMPWLHLPACVLMLAGYLGVAYITHKTQGFYTYSFLDPAKQGPGKLAGYIVGIAVGECVVYAIVYGLVLAKVKLVQRYWCCLMPASPQQTQHLNRGRGEEGGDTRESEERKEGFEEWEEVGRPERV